jgi:hypothetical protein
MAEECLNEIKKKMSKIKKFEPQIRSGKFEIFKKRLRDS